MRLKPELVPISPKVHSQTFEDLIVFEHIDALTHEVLVERVNLCHRACFRTVTEGFTFLTITSIGAVGGTRGVREV